MRRGVRLRERERGRKKRERQKIYRAKRRSNVFTVATTAPRCSSCSFVFVSFKTLEEVLTVLNKREVEDSI